MLFLIYKTTCLINGKIYVGAHATDTLDDGYLGSGLLISKALRKYGKDAFRREVLFVLETVTEMLAKEAEIVDQAFIERADTYNLVVGGRSFFSDQINSGVLLAQSMVLTFAV